MSRTSNRTASAGPKLSPSDALDILASALNYCRDAGIQYWLANGTKGEGLLIRMPGAMVTEDGEWLVTRPIEGTPSPID